MEAPLALLVGVLFATGAYAMLRGNLLRLVIGIILLTGGINVLIFAVGGLVRVNPPLIPAGAELPPEPFAPALPQAMIMTAIVIGFGLVVFTLVLAYRAHQATGLADPDAMSAALPADDAQAHSLPEGTP